MSVITNAIRKKSTKLQEPKIEILLKVEKRSNGLAINVKSKDLKKLAGDFYLKCNRDRNKAFDYLPNPHTIIKSINWNENFRSNRLVYDKYINLNLLRVFMNNDITEYTHLINNVFTNDEIKTYVETFESMITKMKQLVGEKNKRTRVKKVKEPEKTVSGIDLSNIDFERDMMYNNIPIAIPMSDCQRGTCTVCNSYNELVRANND